MKPDQFTMWLRGALDSVGEGEAIPAKLAGLIHEKLTEVVGQQVADRMRESQPYPFALGGAVPSTPVGMPFGSTTGGYVPITTSEAIASRALDLEQYKMQTQYQLELAKMEACK